MSGCKTCTSGIGEKVSGCNNNGGCATGGCNKMNVFDWLSNMDIPKSERFDIVEVRFKGGQKEFFRNTNQLPIVTGDPVIVDVPKGHHLGFVSLQGELVRLQMKKKNVVDNEEIKSIYRIATQKDIEKFRKAQEREMPTLHRTREIIQKHMLEMKLNDVEFQADETKATFYYSAEDRVDFRLLIKELAAEFRVRIEMRQINLRQEAGRLGGIGSCGRELCCSTWLTEFKNVSTSAARYQNLSLNPSKLSGQCGRLKCCLNYELQTYMEALKDIPDVKDPLETEQGRAFLQKTDIFRKIMWFGYREDNNWHPLSTNRVVEILKMNKEGKKPATLVENQDTSRAAGDAISKELRRMDAKYQNPGKKGNKGKQKRKKIRKKPRNPNDSGQV